MRKVVFALTDVDIVMVVELLDAVVVLDSGVFAFVIYGAIDSILLPSSFEYT